jgi:hypothetical protein
MVKKVIKPDLKELEQKTEQLLKDADELVKQPLPTEAKYQNPPPQGSVVHYLVRNQEMADKVPPEMRPLLLDAEGKPLPDWMQVAKMFARPHKKVCIIGFADTRNEAPFTDPSWEIWGLNDLHGSLPRYDRWFDIHTRDNIDEDVKLGRTPADKCGLGGLRTLNVPIYMQDKYADVPNSIKFPLQEIKDKFGDYFTNSISYMTAMAIFEGYNEIAIYGVDMAVGCLAAETRVLTADLRWVQSGDVKVGDELIGFDENSDDGNGKSRRWRKTKVTNCPQIMRPCFKIYLEDGTEFIASEQHGWLCHGENINKWKTTEQLVTHAHRSGRPTRICKVIEPWEDDDKSYDRGYIAAAFDGEGCFTQHPRKDHEGSYACGISFAQKKNAMQTKVARALKKFGFDFGIQETESECDTLTIRGGKPEVIRALGYFRPVRLLEKFKAENLGEMQRIKDVAVIGIERIGDYPVIGLETESKTYIAEGFCSHNSEYVDQRPSCEYFIGLARGAGIKVYIPPASDLCKTRFMYAFDAPKQNVYTEKITSMLKNMQQRDQQMQHQIREMERAHQQYEGAIGATKEIQKIWANLDDTI